MQEIKKCQFCGSNELDIEVTLDRESGKKYRVHCRQCGANGPLRDDEDNAILWWNNRINEVPEMPQEKPLIISANKYNKFGCPIQGPDKPCNGYFCMLWVSVGNDKGRCGLVNTMYMNSIGCGYGVK